MVSSVLWPAGQREKRSIMHAHWNLKTYRVLFAALAAMAFGGCTPGQMPLGSSSRAPKARCAATTIEVRDGWSGRNATVEPARLFSGRPLNDLLRFRRARYSRINT